MNRDIASNVLNAYGNPQIVTEGGIISFARQTEEDLQEIESKTDDELISQWKTLVFLNEIVGHVSLNDLQRISLIELEFEERESIDIHDLESWMVETSRKFLVCEGNGE